MVLYNGVKTARELSDAIARSTTCFNVNVYVYDYEVAEWNDEDGWGLHFIEVREDWTIVDDSNGITFAECRNIIG